MIRTPQRIIIVRTDRIGDVVLSTPVIENVRRAYPGAFIAFMCRPYTKDILEGNPYLDEIIVYDKHEKHRSFFSTVLFAFSLRKKKFDLAIVLHPTNRAHFIGFFAGIPRRVGWDRKMGFLLTQRVVHTKQEGKKHESEYTLDLIRSLGIPVTTRRLFFPLRHDSQLVIEEMLKRYGITRHERLVIINPSASDPSRCWPQEYFNQLIYLLKGHCCVRVAVIASPEKADCGALLLKCHPDTIDLRAKLTLSQLGALLNRASLLISNDSGPVHVAAALGIPVISIFSRSNPGLSPARWRPLGGRSVYFHKNAGCQVCLAHNCQRGFLCLKAITPQEVFAAAKSLL